VNRRDVISLLRGAAAWPLTVPGRNLIAAGFAAILALTARDIAAQNFPTRPVTFIVPWPAGGTTDVALRAIYRIRANMPMR
jgi:hypothetical protein